MSVPGQSRHFGCEPVTSGLHPAPDISLRAATTVGLKWLGSCFANAVDVGGSIPSTATTAEPRHARYQASVHLPVA